MAESKDYYGALGVRKDASSEEIQRQYRLLARRYHPDINPDNPVAEAHFKEISEAYTCLKDPFSRDQYDQRKEVSITLDPVAFVDALVHDLFVSIYGEE